MSVEMSPPYTVAFGYIRGRGVRCEFLTMAQVAHKNPLAITDLIWLKVESKWALLSLEPVAVQLLD